ncbi:MAG: serine/threonine protein kinase [Oscillochloris sp.]|nr:serine/threonine protein kinase [Oscillochloris sp.]
MTNLLGRRLGRYEIRAELGRGGMARVYRAIDTLLQRPVAIKVLAAQLSMDPEFVQRFEREARTAANLRHPGIVTIYDVGEQDGLYFIAMEFIDGRTLHSILDEQSTLGLGYAVSILDPVAKALDFAHAQGAVHRDVKPHNIMIDTTGRVVLTDFGIAQTPDADSQRLTRTGVFMGTPEYISPEQAEARRVDGRSDLYSLGVVAYEIITGRVPFSGATPQLIVSHAQLPPPPPTSVLAYLPSELDVVLARALAKRPESRYPSGSALVEALRGVAQRYSTPLADHNQIAALVGIPQPHTTPITATPKRPTPPPVIHPPSDSAANVPTSPRPRTDSQPAINITRPDPPNKKVQTAKQSNNPSPLAMLLIGGLLVGITLLLILTVGRGLARNSDPTTKPLETRVTPSIILEMSATPVVPSVTAVVATDAPPDPTIALSPSPMPVPPSPIPVIPSSIPVATDTSVPENTPTPENTSTPDVTPIPNDTPVPTEIPTPSDTAGPTNTPAPTDTSAPTDTPEPEISPILGSPVVVTPLYPSP